MDEESRLYARNQGSNWVQAHDVSTTGCFHLIHTEKCWSTLKRFPAQRITMHNKRKDPTPQMITTLGMSSDT